MDTADNFILYLFLENNLLCMNGYFSIDKVPFPCDHFVSYLILLYNHYHHYSGISIYVGVIYYLLVSFV